MPRRLIPIILFAAPALFPAHSSSAQSLPPSSSGPCTLQGSVVDAVSGQPVPHALVKLSAAAAARATLTDSAGRFQFEALPAGPVTLEAEKPGFLTRDRFGRWSPPTVALQLAPDSPPALLKLVSEGVIFGQVSDENGEPLEGFTIRLLLRRPGHRSLTSEMLHRATITDDQGRFRIAGLRPGFYYLEARPVHEPALSATGKSFAPSGYSPAFYPGVKDIASAVPLKILPGRMVQATLSLKREPFVQLSGTVSGYTPDEQITVSLEDPFGVSASLEIVFDRTTGAFHTQWVPPGVYTISSQSAVAVVVDEGNAVSIASQSSATGPSGFTRAPTTTFASLRVNATTSQSNLHLALQPTIEIPVVVHGLPTSNDESLQPVPPALVLLPKEPFLHPNPNVGAQPISLNPQPTGDFHAVFAGLMPGTYELEIAPQQNAAYYAESATWGSTDLLREDLILDSSGSIPPIQMTVRDDGATLNGKVHFGDIPLPAQVVLLTDKPRAPVFLPVSSDGIFSISGLAPGAYRIFAVDSSADFDYQDPAFLAKISSKIQEVTLAPKQSASINLGLAAVGESAP